MVDFEDRPFFLLFRVFFFFERFSAQNNSNVLVAWSFGMVMAFLIFDPS